MKCYLILLISGLFVVRAFPSHHPYSINPGVGAIYKGHNSETIIEGPDGSVITSEEAKGGAIVVTDDALPAPPAPVIIPAVTGVLSSPEIPVVHNTPLLSGAPTVFAAPEVYNLVQNTPLVSGAPAVFASPEVYNSPVVHNTPLVSGAPVLFASSPAVVHNSPGVFAPPAPSTLLSGSVASVELQANPIIVPDVVVVAKDPKIIEEHVIVGNKVISVPKIVEEDTDLIGPSGTISTRGGDAVISGPSSTTIKGGGVVASIDKQTDVKIKSVELKPVIAPVVASPAVITNVVSPAQVVEQETIISTQPLVTEARPILAVNRPAVYAAGAPIVHGPKTINGLGANLLPGLNPIIRPTIFKNGPIVGPGFPLNPSDFDGYPLPHYAPSLNLPLKPVYRGPLH